MDRIADYHLIRPIGEGNNGHFYLAKPPARLRIQDEHVAVKVITGIGTTDDTFRRATRELRVFASVQSTHLIRVLDAGQDGTTFFYATEYLPLGSLARPASVLTRAQKLTAVADAALAAHALHEAGVVHRDIKPANVLLHDDGARLSDLGLAQVLAPGMTVTGMGALGSIQYTAPALLRGSRASRSTDIWSLGATLHYALTGMSVYPSLPQNDALLAVRAMLKSGAQLATALTPPEREVLLKCVDPAAAKHFPTAAALAEQIEELNSAGSSDPPPHADHP